MRITHSFHYQTGSPAGARMTHPKNVSPNQRQGKDDDGHKRLPASKRPSNTGQKTALLLLHSGLDTGRQRRLPSEVEEVLPIPFQVPRCEKTLADGYYRPGLVQPHSCSPAHGRITNGCPRPCVLILPTRLTLGTIIYHNSIAESFPPGLAGSRQPVPFFHFGILQEHRRPARVTGGSASP